MINEFYGTEKPNKDILDIELPFWNSKKALVGQKTLTTEVSIMVTEVRQR